MDAKPPQHLVDNVKNDPHDDTARLVLADWLEEHGLGSQADFQRWMVDAHPIRSLSPRTVSSFPEQVKLKIDLLPVAMQSLLPPPIRGGRPIVTPGMEGKVLMHGKRGRWDRMTWSEWKLCEVDLFAAWAGWWGDASRLPFG